MKFIEKNYLDRFFTPKIETCRSQNGDYVVKLTASHWEYFWERKKAKEFIKNYTKEK